MRPFVHRRGQICQPEWTHRLAALSCALILAAAAPAAAADGDGAGPRPGVACGLDGLVVTTADGPVVVPLPGRCASADGDGRRAVVAGGADGAWLVEDGAGAVPRVTPVPSTGVVADVALRDGYLLVTEQVDQVRWVNLEQLLRSVSAAASVDAPPGEGGPEEPARTRIGTVVDIRGPRVFVAGDGIEDGPADGDWIAVVRPPVPKEVDPATGRLRERGEPGYESVIRVVGNDGSQLVAEVGRGDRVRLGDRVYTGGALEPTEQLTDPHPIRPLTQVGVELVPAVSLSDPGVVGLGRAWASYSFGFPMRVEIALRQGVLAVPRGGEAVVGGAAEVLASLDLPAFEIGLTGGYQRFENPGGGVLLGHYLRFGYRDGFLVEVRTRFLLPPADFFGGVEGRIVIPMDRLASLTLEGGGGSSVGFALIGVQVHAIGQGGRGSLLINPGVGFVLNQWVERGTFDDRWHELAGPAIAMRVEYRP